MRQYIPTSRTGLLGASNVALQAALDNSGAIALVHNKSETILADRTAAALALDAREVGKHELRARRKILESKRREARDFAMLTRDILKTVLGRVHTPAWDITGFKGSFRVPVRADGLETLMEILQQYFVANPDKQKIAMNVTAERAGELCNELKSARVKVKLHQAALGRLTQVRKEKFALLYKRLSNLVKELSQLIPADDSRWIAFGFNKPGQMQTPEVPKQVEAVLIGTNAVAMKWERAPRARYYRTWKKVIGVDAEPKPVGSPADLDFALEDLVAGSEVELSVSAVNDGGESARSEVVRVRLSGEGSLQHVCFEETV